MYSLFQKP